VKKKVLGIPTTYQSNTWYIAIVARSLHFDLIIQLRVYISQRRWRMRAWMRMIPANQCNAFPFHSSRNFSFHSCSSWFVLAGISTRKCTCYRKVCNNVTVLLIDILIDYRIKQASDILHVIKCSSYEMYYVNWYPSVHPSSHRFLCLLNDNVNLPIELQ